MKCNATKSAAKAASKAMKTTVSECHADSKSASAACLDHIIEASEVWCQKYQEDEVSALTAASTTPQTQFDGRRVIWPPCLSPLPGIHDILRMTPKERLRLFEYRATVLMRTIHGLRRGIYTPLPGRTVSGMVRNANRRFNHLQHRAMQAGLWTDGRWDYGEEETHLV